MCVFETSRCQLKAFKKDDFEKLFSLHGSKKVMQYVGKGVRTKEEVQKNLEGIIEHQEKFGYSSWGVYEKETGLFIGRAGLIQIGTLIDTNIKRKQDKRVELGYLLHPEFWGKGFATELSKGVIKWAFEQTTLEEIIAKTGKANIGSQKVIHNNKMTFQKNITIEGIPGLFFSITRKSYYSHLE